MSIIPRVYHKPTHSTAKAFRRRAFTLVELLVVITIIGILSAVVLSAVNGNDEIQSVNAGVNRASGIFNLARSASITRKTPIRVLVHFDPPDPANPTDPRRNLFLRYMVILYYDTSVATPVWRVYSDGEFLPTGVFFSPALSSTPSVRLSTWTVPIPISTMVVGTPIGNPSLQPHYAMSATGDTLNHVGAPSSGNTPWYVFEYSANGTMAKPGSRFVVAKGILSASPPAIRTTRPDLIGGFTVFRAGRTLHFQDPRQITGGL
jgi:prepilin-type N-terminal cleavage/methylation domain-containing protein